MWVCKNLGHRTQQKKKKGTGPWSSNCIKKGNDGGDINGSPLWNLYFRNQNCHRQYNTVKSKGDNMGYDLPNKEEAIDHMYFLPQRYFLQSMTENK